MKSLLNSVLLLCLCLSALVNLKAQTIDVFPHFDDLETWDTCDVNCNSVCIISSDWSNVGNIDFKPDSAGTPTALTGPLVDNNPGLISGIYAVVESSGLCNGDTAALESPFIDLTSVQNPRFAFAYHLQWAVAAPDTFDVLVSIDSGTTWSLGYTGQNVNSNANWVSDTMDLTPYMNNTIKLRIRFVTSQEFHDFALDDFAFLGIKDLNAGIDSVYISSGFCEGDSSELCVNLVNEGTVPIDTVTIRSSVNGLTLFAPFNWTNTLPPGEDTALCIGQTILSQGDSIAFYTEMPNNQIDSLNNNDTFSILATLNPLPNAQIAPINTTICIEDTLLISASGGIQYQWNPIATLSSPNTANTNAYPIVSTTYTVTVTDANGCSATDSAEVPVYPLTQANAGPDVAICQQDTVVLGASGGVTYVWSNPFLMDGENTAAPSAYPIQTTTFTVTVTDANGCSETDDMLITVNPLPIAAGGPDERICLNELVQIGGSPTGPFNATFNWSPIIGLDDPSLGNPTASPLSTTRYRVTVTSIDGCSDSADAIVRVDTLPVVEVVRAVDRFCQKDSGKIIVTPGFEEYLWSPNQAISNPRADSISVYPNSDKLYTVSVTDQNGCRSSISHNIRVWRLPTVTASDEAEICEGDSVSIEASANGGVLYRWSDGATLTDSNAQITMAKPIETNTYSVTATDTNGCENLGQTRVVVFPKPFIDAGEDIANCDIDVVQLGGEPSGPGDAVYTWSPQIGLSDPFSPNPTLLSPETFVYFLEVQDRNGCFNSDSVIVNADCFTLVYAPSAFTPGSNDVNDIFKLEHYKVVDPTLTIFNKWGRVVFETTDLNVGWDGRVAGQPAQTDTYYWFLSYRTHDLKKADKEGTVTLIR